MKFYQTVSRQMKKKQKTKYKTASAVVISSNIFHYYSCCSPILLYFLRITKKTGRGRFLYEQLGPTIVYSERTNEELEELFRTIIHDEEFLNVCQNKIHQYEQAFTTTKFEYDDVSQNHHEQDQPQIVHEINMSVYYNVEIDKNNSDVTFVNRIININSDENKTSNRFSNLNLSNDIDRLVKAHDYVQHSHQQEKKPKIQQRQTPKQVKRHATISTTDETYKYDSAVLAQIVEQQLTVAAKNKQQFNPIHHKPTNIKQPSINRPNFVQPTKLIPKINDEQTRHRIDHIEYPKTNLTRLRKTSQNISSKNERENLLRLSQQGILSTARAFATSKIPENIKTIDLLELPNTKLDENFRLISYETVDNQLIRSNSLKQLHKLNETSSKRSSMILSSPLKSIKRHVEHKNQRANLNKQVSKEKTRGNKQSNNNNNNNNVEMTTAAAVSL